MITFYITCIIYRNFPLERVPSIYQDEVIAEVVAAGFPEKVGVNPDQEIVEEPQVEETVEEQELVNAE